MAEPKQRAFPNIPVAHWNNLRNQFKKSIPGTITPNYIASILGMTEISARSNIIPSLKLIGLIDEEGKINQDSAKKFRDDSQYIEFCKEIIKKAYPQELIDAFPDKDSDRRKVLSWFMNHTGGGETGANRMVAFYLALVEADPSPTKASKVAQPRETRPNVVQKNKTSTPKVTTPKEPEILSENKPPKQQNIPSVNLNIQIHISSDASSDQIKSIFENMAKYIYKD